MVQLLLTSFVMTRFGVGIALMFLPVVALCGSLGYLLAPILLFGSLLNTTDNGFSYSINQSAKEVLYTTVSREEKYQAKAFIDIFTLRLAKGIAVFVSLLLTLLFAGFENSRWLSLVAIALLAIWIVIVRKVGRSFADKEQNLQLTQD